MTRQEEVYLLQKVTKTDLDTAPCSVRRLCRKLAVRKTKREYGLPLLNIDSFGSNSGASAEPSKHNDRVLDRFFVEDLGCIFEQRLQGYCEPTAVHSPYTNRLLKPFIRRDTSSQPLWLRIMDQVCLKANKNNPEWRPLPKASIDYSYIKPQHIPAINSLCSQFFWPGIDRKHVFQNLWQFLIRISRYLTVDLEIFAMSSCFSDRMFAVSGLHLRCIVQKISHRFCGISTGCRVQRSVHLVHPDTAGVARGRHRHVHVVPSDTDVHGTGRHVTRVGHEPRLDTVPKVQLQSGGVCSGLLRQVHAAEFTGVQTRSVFTFKQIKVHINLEISIDICEMCPCDSVYEASLTEQSHRVMDSPTNFETTCSSVFNENSI